MKLINIFFFLLLTLGLQAQEEISVIENNHQHAHRLQGTVAYRIGYGERLEQMYFIGDPNMKDTSWIIKNQNRKIIKKGKGTLLGDYIFEKPGKYTVEMTLNSEIFKKYEGKCFHTQLPAEIHVKVSENKVIFLTDEITFKEPLKGNKEQFGNVLYVPVMVSTYQNKPFAFKNNEMIANGISANLKGYLLKDKQLLKVGKQILEYHLVGTLKSDTYVMLDFKDAADNIQSVTLLKKIN